MSRLQGSVRWNASWKALEILNWAASTKLTTTRANSNALRTDGTGVYAEGFFIVVLWFVIVLFVEWMGIECERGLLALFL